MAGWVLEKMGWTFRAPKKDRSCELTLWSRIHYRNGRPRIWRNWMKAKVIVEKRS